MKAVIVLLWAGLVACEPQVEIFPGFFLGLIEGFEEDSTNPGPCMQQFSKAVAAYDLVRLPAGVNDVGTAMIRMRDFLNEATLLDQTCGFRDLTSQILRTTQVGGLEEVAVSIVANMAYYKQIWSNWVIAFNNGISYDVGWNTAKLISKLFNYSI